jgi:pimeloyl-ACP methyl ester carboxylesterase
MAAGTANVNGIEIAYETLGDASDQPLLLVMGLGMQLIHWDRNLCDQLAARGFYVIRFDNRDSGLSTHIDAPLPDLRRAMIGLHTDAPYLLDDMAADAFGLLDHLGIEAAHVVGVSMGGMIAQTMAIARPERVLSLTSIMSTTGNRRVGLPKLRVWSVLLRQAPRDREGYIEHFVRVFRMIGSRRYPMSEPRIRQLAADTWERDHHASGTPRQLAAILASGDRTAALRSLRLPVTVIHGRDDPLVPFRGGRATAAAIPGARLIAIPGMGHDLPEQLWPQFIDAVVETAARADGDPRRASAPGQASRHPASLR